MRILENWESRELEILSFILRFGGFGLSCHFLVEKAQGEIEKISVTSGKGKQVLVIKRFEEPGFHQYSISYNLFLKLTLYSKLISKILTLNLLNNITF